MYYHYCSINNEKRYMQSNLEQGCLHFSDVNSFNDASEFSYAISNDHSLLTNEEKRSVKFFFDFLRNDMEKSGKKVPYTMHSVFHDLEFELGMDKKLIKSNESLKALMFFSTEYMIEGLRSLCLTKNVKSIPMWGYYGDGMKGVCLGFDIDDGSLMQVKYYKENEKLPEVCAENIVNFATSERYDYIKRIVSCKSSGWKHEEEFRWIDHSYNLDEFSNKKIDKKKLKEIVFGSRCDIVKVKEILEIIDNDSDYKDVQFKISVASKTKYCVDIYNVGNGFNLIKCLDALQDDKYKFHVISNSLGTYMDALEIENFNQVFIF